MPCHCSDCSGDPLPTYTESWRHQTEVKYVAKQNSAWIKEFLEKVKVKRGDDAYHRLRDDVLKVWNK